MRHLSIEQVLSLVHTSHCCQLEICGLLCVTSGQEMDKTVIGRLKLMITGNSQEMVVEGMVHRLLSVGNNDWKKIRLSSEQEAGKYVILH